MRTIREQNIEHVAGIIAASDLSPEAAEAANRIDGWGFDVRYDAEEYVSETDFTRVEDLQLDPADLRRAIELAARYQRGEQR